MKAFLRLPCAKLPPIPLKKSIPRARKFTPLTKQIKVFTWCNRGEVLLYHSKNGKRAIFDVLPPGSVFGNFDPSLKKPTHFAETTKGTLLCVTPTR